MQWTPRESLYLETDSQPIHVCSSTMPGGYTFDALREALSPRLNAMPELREKAR